jgi:hypothetical protein
MRPIEPRSQCVQVSAALFLAREGRPAFCVFIGYCMSTIGKAFIENRQIGNGLPQTKYGPRWWRSQRICFNKREKAGCWRATIAERLPTVGKCGPSDGRGPGMGEYRRTILCHVSRVGPVNIRKPPQCFRNLGKNCQNCRGRVGYFHRLCYPTVSGEDA